MGGGVLQHMFQAAMFDRRTGRLWAGARDPLDRFLPVVARLHDVPVTPQDVGEHLARQTIVVRHE